MKHNQWLEVLGCCFIQMEQEGRWDVSEGPSRRQLLNRVSESFDGGHRVGKPVRDSETPGTSHRPKKQGRK